MTKRITIRDVGKLAGVSRTTVSLVLNNSPVPSAETRARVLKVVNELNYKPDPLLQKALQSRRCDGQGEAQATRTLGYLTVRAVLEEAKHNDGYYSQVMAGIQRSIDNRCYHLMVKALPVEGLLIPDMVVESRVDGLLIEGHFQFELLRHLVNRLPVALLDNTIPELGANSVMPDIECAVMAELDYLWALGHRRIVVFVPTAPIIHLERYQRAFHHFFALRDASLVDQTLCRPRAITPETHVQVMAEYTHDLLAANPRPTALMSWDFYASSLVQELARYGIRVPEDISVIGLTDSESARRSQPPLTTYRFPMDEMGRSGAELVMDQIADRKRSIRHLLLSGSLVERNSCGFVKSC